MHIYIYIYIYRARGAVASGTWCTHMKVESRRDPRGLCMFACACTRPEKHACVQSLVYTCESPQARGVHVLKLSHDVTQEVCASSMTFGSQELAGTWNDSNRHTCTVQDPL